MARQKTAVITGSAGGIGEVISQLLAEQGWNLVLVNRNRDKAEAQLVSLRERGRNQAFHSHIANLLDLQEVRELARQISRQHPSLSALYNVAGLLTDRRTVSKQGIEGHFAVNTVAPVLLAGDLRSSLAAGSGNGRASVVVNFSSSAVGSIKSLDIDGLSNPDNVGGLMGAYAESKMALTIATAMMADDLRHDNILSLAVDPGATKTSMTGSADGMPWYVRLLVPILFKSAAVQARKVVQGVESAVAEKKTGLFIAEGRRKPMPELALDPDVRSRLRAYLGAILS